jgi:hypothetical protein
MIGLEPADPQTFFVWCCACGPPSWPFFCVFVVSSFARLAPSFSLCLCSSFLSIRSEGHFTLLRPGSLFLLVVASGVFASVYGCWLCFSGRCCTVLLVFKPVASSLHVKKQFFIPSSKFLLSEGSWVFGRVSSGGSPAHQGTGRLAYNL